MRLKLSLPIIQPLVTASLLALYVLSSAAASTPKNKYFQENDAVPAGFEALDNAGPTTTLVSVYYQDRLLLNTTATFTDSEITLDDPGQVLSKLKNIKNRKAVLTAISNKLDAHPQLLCPELKQAFCKPLHPAIAGVIFDALDYKAHLFINPNLISTPQIGRSALPASTTGFSSIMTNHVLFAHGAKTTYGLNTDSTYGYGNGYFITRGFYTRDENNPQHQDVLRIPEFAGEYLKNGIGYSAGVLPTGGNGLFTQTVSMIGVKVNTNRLNDVSNRILSQGSPVIVFLPTQSQVEVFRGGELIYVNDLQAGKHQLNTASFPFGSYDISVRIRNTLGQTTTQNQFVIKRADGVELNKPTYTFAVGVLQKDDISLSQTQNTVQFPQPSNKPVISLDRDELITPYLMLDLNLLSDIKKTFASADMNIFKGSFEITPGVLISSDQEYGVTNSLSYSIKQYAIQAQALKLFGTGRINKAIAENDFMPITATDYQYSTNASYHFKQSRISLFGRWQKSVSGSYSQSTSISYSHALYKSELMDASFDASATKTHDDKIIEAGISLRFKTAHIDGDLNSGFKRDNIGEGNTTEANTVTRTLNLHKSIQFDKRHRLAWNAGYSRDNITRTLRGGIHYVSLPAQLRMSYINNKTLSSSNSSDSYSAQLDSSLVYANGKTSVGFNNSLDSGVILEVQSPMDGQTRILSNNQPLATISNNAATPIFLTPYNTYNITINPVGAGTQFQYDTSPKTVTLYRGNIQHLAWTLTQMHILFAEITNPQGNPLPDLLLKQKSQYNTTDEFGYLQAEIPTGISSFNFVDIDGRTCQITLPKDAKLEDGLMVLDKPLICDLKEPKK